MSKRYEGASVRPQALVLSPEAPYPPAGGGALRSASVIDYLARRYNVDVITFSESPDDRREFPADRVRHVLTLDLPYHSKTPLARAGRNFGRFVNARPPLLDRYSGFDAAIAKWVGDRVYSVAVIEHFWCAPYAATLLENTERLILDMHNVESALQETTAQSESWPLKSMFKRFAAAYVDLEREWLPRFDLVLATSIADAERIHLISSTVPVTVYPNTIPRQEQPDVPEQPAIAFSGNLQYFPNAAAIRWFGERIWPLVRARHPEIEWRLIGKNPGDVSLRAPGMRIVGPVDDAVRELAAAQVAVVPLLSGSGTRFKIVEAWAAGRPVVSTTLGAEGLGAKDGEHLLLADDPAGFATAVNSLLEDEPLRRRLGAAGRKLYLDRYTTEAGWRVLDSAGF